MKDIDDMLPPLEKSIVHIIRFSDKVPSTQKADFLGLLTPEDEVEFRSCIASPERERRRLFRGIFRAVLASYCSTSPAALRFASNSHGKPFLQPSGDSQTLEFNLSHSGGRGLLAVSLEVSVGIDLEKITRRNHIREIAARFFTPEEQDFLYADGNAEALLERFYCLWTRKEAVVKAMGESLPRWLLEIPVLPPGPADAWCNVQTPCLPDGVLMSLDAGPGYAGALCAETLPEKTETFSIEALGGQFYEDFSVFR